MEDSKNMFDTEIKTKCGMYARYSSKNQRESSIEDQLRNCRDKAQMRNMEVLEEYIYTDKAKSGRKTAGRDEFMRMMSIIESSGIPPIDYLLIDDTSRIARNLGEALKIFAKLQRKGVKVWSVSQDIDTGRDDFSLLPTLAIQSLFDDMFCKQLAQKTLRGLEGRAQQGFSTGGRIFGYKSIPVYSEKRNEDVSSKKDIIAYKLVILEEEAEIVRKIFRLYGEKHCSPKKIVDILNHEIVGAENCGKPFVSAVRNKFWSVQTIIGNRKLSNGVLNNAIYIGVYIWGKSKSEYNSLTGEKKKKLNLDKNKIIKKEMPELRIVDQTLWDRVKNRQDQILKRGNNKYKSAKKLYSKHLLTGICQCGICGGTFGIVSGGKFGKYGCINNWNRGSYACQNTARIPKDLLEDLVINTICKELIDDKSLTDVLNQLHINLSEYFRSTIINNNSQAIEDKLFEVDNKIDNIIRFIENGGSNSGGIANQLLRLEHERENLKHQLLVCSIKNIPDFVTLIQQDDLRNYFSVAIMQLLYPTSKIIKDALSNIVDKIIVKTSGTGVIAIDIFENIHDITKAVFAILNEADSRIRYETGSRFIPYTTRIFHIDLIDPDRSGRAAIQNTSANIYILKKGGL
jgi:DNA invertase Pin-like site-specific DNA recombinase